MTKRSKSLWKHIWEAVQGKKKLTKKTRASLSGIAGVASLVLTLLVFTRAHRETKIQLDETEARTDAIEAMLDSTDFGYAIMDQEGKVIEWNPALERLSHWSEKEVKDKGLEVLMPPDLFIRHSKSISKVMGEDILSGKVSIVNCEIKPHEEGSPPLPVKITVRTVQSKKGKRYAIAHVDRQKQIQTFSLP